MNIWYDGEWEKYTSELVVHQRGIELKRTPEFVLGLIGGILGIIISIILIVVAFNIMEGVDYELLAYYSIILTVQIGLFILSCLVNKVNNKVYGVCMIVIPIVMLFMSLFFLLIPTILQIYIWFICI